MCCCSFAYEENVDEVRRVMERYGPVDSIDMKTGPYAAGRRHSATPLPFGLCWHGARGYSLRATTASFLAGTRPHMSSTRRQELP